MYNNSKMQKVIIYKYQQNILRIKFYIIKDVFLWKKKEWNYFIWKPRSKIRSKLKIWIGNDAKEILKVIGGYKC